MLALRHSDVTVWSRILGPRQLLWQLTRRNIMGRYRGSFLGLLWSLITPLAMLAIYGFVFGVVMHVEWSNSPGMYGFALTLFIGLIVFGLFADVVNQAAVSVIANPNYVKKVRFPLEIIPVAKLGEGLFHFATGGVILLLGELIFLQRIPATALFLPLVLLPLVLLTMGLAWFLAALGVFVRDVPYVVNIATNILFFASAIIYPIEAVPSAYRFIVYLNPVAGAIHHCREVLMWGRLPNPAWMCYTAGVGILVFYLGFAFFERTRKAFADVI